MPDAEDVLHQRVCPFLGTTTAEGAREDFVDYPSFENQCFVGDKPVPVLLTDQATFCLSSGHTHCQLYEAERVGVKASNLSGSSNSASDIPADRSRDPVLHAIAEIEEDLRARVAARTKNRRRWGWIGAIALFVSTLACGGTFAAYLGWRLVNPDNPVAQAGSVTTLSNPIAAAPPALYLVVTATSDPAQAAVQLPQQSNDSSTDERSVEYPPAVTATPLAGAAAPVPATSDSVAIAEPASTNPDRVVVGPEPASTAEPLDSLFTVPTRRPTPILDLAITVPNAAEVTATPFPTPTFTPEPMGTPVVIFAAEDEELMSGKCTKVSWHVENVRAVYYENLGVDGHGEKKECVKDKPGDYTLTVVLPNGATEYYTVTVGLLLPTETPVPTATFVPTARPSPTWTPVIPTDTPTPDMQYRVLLSAEDGTKHNCTAGETCRIDLRITNASLGIDDLSINLEQSGNWSARLCRLDGVCSDSKLTIASVGPSNTALVEFHVDVPKPGAGKTFTYILRAVSEGSGGEEASERLSIDITGQ